MLREDYVKDILEEEFYPSFVSLLTNGLLSTETANLLVTCHPVFDAFHFSEANSDDRFLRYAIIGTIAAYGL
ncbi:MAG: hypothetical protein SGI96_12720 [Bacteroidota bacterium]|nr:hypothetical protein [Bacteroidota bacterium]